MIPRCTETECSCLIGQVVPNGVVVAETRADIAEPLFPAELEALGTAVEGRRREFASGRACARRALAQLGVGPLAIPVGTRGEPRWPAGIVGSITHCRGYRACAVAHAAKIRSIGIDAEPAERLPEGVLEVIATRSERTWLRAQDCPPHMDRVLFSVKEAVFKAWSALTSRPLDFDDVEVVSERHTFVARLPRGGPLQAIHGWWRVTDGLALTAAVVAPDPSAPNASGE
jgi:4'-phosphopantetheinyl transferase EntD